MPSSPTLPVISLGGDAHRHENIEWLDGLLSFALYAVDNGRSLREGVKPSPTTQALTAT